MGYIYLIYNKCNDKVYIGQTIHSIEDRFKQHLYLSSVGDNKLYRAMRELGTENFSVTALLECENSKLSANEAMKIKEYNSIRNGYNSILPTSTVKVYDSADYYGDELLDDYISGMSYNDIGVKYNLSRRAISSLCSSLSDMRKNIRRTNSESVPVTMYNLEFNPLIRFQTIKDAGKWLRENTEFSIEARNLYNYINAACKKGNVAYGHRWQYTDKLVFNGVVFRTTFDIINYINGEEYALIDGVMYCGDIAKHIHVGGWKKKNDINTTGIKQREKVKNKLDPLRENIDLALELYSKHNLSEIGRMYNCSPNAVKRFYTNLFNKLRKINSKTI